MHTAAAAAQILRSECGRLLFRGESAGGWDERVTQRPPPRTKQLTALRESGRVASALVIYRQGDNALARSLSYKVSRLLLRCNNPLADDTQRSPSGAINSLCLRLQTN